MKKLFTKENITTFWKSIADEVDAIDESAKDALDTYEAIMFEAQDQLANDYILPNGYSAEQIINSLEMGYIDYLPFTATNAAPADSAKILSIEDRSDAAKVWRKSSEVLNNLKALCAYIESLDEQNANKLIDTLKKTPSDVPLNKGTICSPKKYLANCPYKLPKGATVIEISVHSSDSAQYRVYGLLVDKKIYL